MRTKLTIAGALTCCALLVGPIAAQQSTDLVGEVPDFLPLQDHTEFTSGEQVYVYWCWHCHGEGPGKPGTTALEALHGDSRPAVLHEREDLTTDFVKFFVRNGTSIMPHFRPTQITDEQLELLANYLAGSGE